MGLLGNGYLVKITTHPQDNKLRMVGVICHWVKKPIQPWVQQVHCLGTAGTLLSAYNAYKANKLVKEQFNHAKQVQAQNWDAQRKQTNSQLEDRQRRRVEEAGANGRTTMSVGDYMAKYGI